MFLALVGLVSAQDVIVGDTFKGVTLIGINTAGDKCIVEYNNSKYTIEVGHSKKIGDAEISVVDTLLIHAGASSCDLILSGTVGKTSSDTVSEKDITVSMAKGQTFKNVTLLRIENGCVFEYDGREYALPKNKERTLAKDLVIIVNEYYASEDVCEVGFNRNLKTFTLGERNVKLGITFLKLENISCAFLYKSKEYSLEVGEDLEMEDKSIISVLSFDADEEECEFSYEYNLKPNFGEIITKSEVVIEENFSEENETEFVVEEEFVPAEEKSFISKIIDWFKGLFS